MLDNSQNLQTLNKLLQHEAFPKIPDLYKIVDSIGGGSWVEMPSQPFLFRKITFNGLNHGLHDQMRQ